MSHLLILGTDRLLPDLKALLVRTGRYTVELTATPDTCLTAAQTTRPDLVLVWFSLFATRQGADTLRSFLAALEGVPIALVVMPAMKPYVEALAPLPVQATWQIAEGDLSGLCRQLGAYEQATARPDSPVTATRPVPVPPAADRKVEHPADQATRRSLAVDKPARQPFVATTPARGDGQPLQRQTPASSGGPRSVGLWSASGGAGVSTLAATLGRLSGRPVLGLSEPDLALALNLSLGSPWTPQSAGGVRVTLAPSRYTTSADSLLDEARTYLGRSQDPHLLDLPAGVAGLPFLRLVDCLVYVLPPERAAVSLAVHALSSVSYPRLVVVWNRAAPQEVSQVRGGLAHLPQAPDGEFRLEDQPAVREARTRGQSLPDAAADGVLLGNLVGQLRELAATIYPDVQPPETGRRRFKLLEVVD